MIKARDCIPKEWIKLIGTGPLGMGFDVATTEQKTSNPSSITIMEKVGPLYVQRLVLRWKTANEEVSLRLLDCIFEDLQLAQFRLRRFCVDASNEKFFAQRIQKRYNRFCPVELVVSNEKIQWLGEDYDYKTLLGSLYVNDFTDALARMPDPAWLRDDHRLVKKVGGRFAADLSPEGGHADTFDSGRLARWALTRGARAEASGAAVGSLGSGQSPVPAGLKNPLLHKAIQTAKRMFHA